MQSPTTNNIFMAKGDTKKWRDKVDHRFDNFDTWRDEADNRFDKIDYELIDFRKWRTNVTHEIIEIKEDLHYIKANMFTAEERNRLMTSVDALATEMKKSQEERIIFSYRLPFIDDQIANHEKRIKVLEKQ
jgi:hypothetical protein